MISEIEQKNIIGGSASAGTIGLIIGGIIFIIGVVDGFVRPLKCNAKTKKKK